MRMLMSNPQLRQSDSTVVFQVQAVDDVPGPIVSFTEQDAKWVYFPHNDALMITVQLAITIIARIMMDSGNVVNILQLSVFQKIGLENTIKRKAKVLTEFNELTSTAIGTIMLDVIKPLIVSSQIFMIISHPSLYNEILG